MATHTAMAQGSNAIMRSLLEQRLGITQFVSNKEHGWSGQTRTRYTDFQVNEITKDGEVVHLKEFFNNAREMARAASRGSAPSFSSQGPPKSETKSIPADEKQTPENGQESTAAGPSTEGGDPSTTDITESDRTALADLVGQTAADELVALYDKIRQDATASRKTQGEVSVPKIEDKARRSQVHGEIRRIFNGKIETLTGSDGSIKATATPTRGGNRQRGNRSTNNGTRNGRQNDANGPNGPSGPFLHFSLYKENKDTMDALSHMAKVLRVHPKAFGAAGTKDRRAVTVQRVSVKGRNPASLLFVNERIPNIKIGDFSYAKVPIKLNDHDGNEFVIVLKNCVFSGTDHLSFEDKLRAANSTVQSALEQITQHGFINYYGTQRFGTHQIGTQDIGMKILKGDFVGAAQALLAYDPLLLQDSSQDQEHIRGVHRDDVSRAQACAKFLESNDSKAALEVLPPRCHVEKALMQHLGRSPSDYLGALMSINRSMRTMYGHAYQSLVWNFVASKRWERFGSQVINGDLVLVKSKSAPALNIDEADIDMAWEDEISSVKNAGLVAHAVTEDDLHDGKYSIYDVVLPTPGWDVIYPPNEIGDFYAEFMGRPENGSLDPYNMRRRQRDFSLPGSYRKLMGKLKRVPTASVQAYSSDLEQLVPTDLDILRSSKAKAAELEHQHGAAAKWQAAAQNIQRIELEESKARFEKRESEGPTPSVRINETWIQTSRDGSNKRMRIARHEDKATDATQASNGHGGEDAQEAQKPPETAISSIFTAVKNQPMPEEAEPEQGSVDGTVMGGGSPRAAQIHTDAEAETVKSMAPSVALPSDSVESPASESPTVVPGSDAADKAELTTAATVEVASPEKIAVILRFALDTSQYATMVIRELQGTPSAGDVS